MIQTFIAASSLISYLLTTLEFSAWSAPKIEPLATLDTPAFRFIRARIQASAQFGLESVKCRARRVSAFLNFTTPPLKEFRRFPRPGRLQPLR